MPNNLEISEVKCEVSLQSLLEHTIMRLFKYLKLDFNEDANTELVLLVKYGFDGTNANRYKQKSMYESSVLDYIFCSSLVPLQLLDKSTGQIFWHNERSSSTRFCRPIKILYEKETAELCRKIEADLKLEIDQLENIEIAGCKVGFEMMLTMIDGKVHTIIIIIDILYFKAMLKIII